MTDSKKILKTKYMNKEFIEKNCFNCSNIFVDCESMCWLAFDEERNINPSIEEMSECPLNKDL